MNRVFILGWDGATFDLIEPWVAEGKLPNIARIMSSGVHGRLRSTLPPMTFPAWSSFMTGKNPGKHGILEFFLRRPGTFEEMAVNQRLRDSRAIWDLLGDAGIRSLVTNVPCTYPPEEIDGVMISDFLTPAGRRDFALRFGVGLRGLPGGE